MSSEYTCAIVINVLQGNPMQLPFSNISHLKSGHSIPKIGTQSRDMRTFDIKESMLPCLSRLEWVIPHRKKGSVLTSIQLLSFDLE